MKGCRPLNEAELERLLRAINGRYAARDRALLMLGVVTGYRISELLSLSIDDVWQFGQVTTHVAVERKVMKGQREGRTVPLNQKVRPYLVEWVRFSLNAGRTLASPLFWSNKLPDQPIDRRQASRILGQAKKTARLHGKINTHTMRKTFAKNMYDRLEGDIFKVKTALGHKSVDSTVAYMSFNQNEIDRAILADD
jgi:integrase